MPRRSLCTPVGTLTLTEENGAITRAEWGGKAIDDTALLQEACAQVSAYFDGTRTEFDLPMHLSASPSQRAVCAAIAAIPFGQTRTYGDLAKELDMPAQVVGQGCGGNPIPILIPCHRVLGASGLGGFSGGTGIETKVALLKHEGAASLLI